MRSTTHTHTHTHTETVVAVDNNARSKAGMATSVTLLATFPTYNYLIKKVLLLFPELVTSLYENLGISMHYIEEQFHKRLMLAKPRIISVHCLK